MKFTITFEGQVDRKLNMSELLKCLIIQMGFCLSMQQTFAKEEIGNFTSNYIRVKQGDLVWEDEAMRPFKASENATPPPAPR